MKILIVEDNPDIAANIGDYLELQGHVVDFAGDGAQGLRLALEHYFDVMVLDINLPKMDGFQVCQQLRTQHGIELPILMLTARDALSDKIKGFESGAWDYLVKPFALPELDARLRSLAQRTQSKSTALVSVGDLSLDPVNLKVFRAGTSLKLHKICVTILELLMRQSPNVVSRRDIEHLLWGENAPDSNPLRSHMHEIRNAVDKPYEFSMIKTVRGHGYQLLPSESDHEH